MKRTRLTARHAGLLLVSTVLGACALTQLQPDRQARAPVIDGFGATTMRVTTSSPDAARLFRQGMAQAYGFNDAEAVRSFKAALAQDPACAMCAWGVAYQLGPNINRDRNEQVAEALQYVEYAQRRAAGLSPLERGLIDALAQRYARGAAAGKIVAEMAPLCSGTGRAGAIHPLDMAYAVSMRKLADSYPDDPDVQAMYAEAEMIVTPTPWWDPVNGKPNGRIADVAGRIETAMRQHRTHVGLTHYMIHAVDAGSQAARAVPAADQLAVLAPNSPHLVHMPSHIFARVGRYADAAAVNAQALAAENTLDASLSAQGFKPLNDWRSHNADFLVFSALMEGRGAAALAAARDSATRSTGGGDYHQFKRSMPALLLTRLERWQDVLAEPAPREKAGAGAILHQYARGMALARAGQGKQAAQVLLQLKPAVQEFLKTRTSEGFGDRIMRALAQVSIEELSAEVAAYEGRGDAALAHADAAEKASISLDRMEPPVLAGGARLLLGDMQLRQGKWTDAEATFRRDLLIHPNSGWALRGLARALRGQGRAPEAAQAQQQMAKAWPLADASLQATMDERRQAAGRH